MTTFIDLTGQKFSRLSVIRRLENHPDGVRSYWLCVCTCGKETKATGSNLRYKTTKSCGCWSKERKQKFPRIKHGMSYTKIYKVWCGMKDRCSNIFHNRYECYGGRGISVCSRWINSFENFYADMGDPPIGFSIDRINNNGNYEPSNCRWASRSTQRKNRRGRTKFPILFNPKEVEK